MADVPVGAFLSGGIDSSTVVALYQKYSSVPVRSFTIGFEDDAFQRSRICARGRATSRHRPSRANMSRRRKRPRGHPAPAGDVRRAVRRFVGHSRPTSSAVRPPAGDGRAQRRRRRRAVRRLPPPLEALALWNKLRRFRSARAARGPRPEQVPFGFWTACRRADGASRRNPLSGKVHKGLRVGACRRATSMIFIASYARPMGASRIARRERGRPQPLPARPGLRRAPDATADDLLRRARLFARRHPLQGRPRVDGGQPRNRAFRSSTIASPRSPRASRCR